MLKRWTVGALLTLAVPVMGVAQAGRRAYTDRANSVSFTYPAGWLLNADDDAATAKFRITTEAQPIAVVQLEGNFADSGSYKGTDFEAGAFAYVVSPRKSAELCFAALDPIVGDEQKVVSMTWNGLPSRKLTTTYGIAGTKDSHEIIATYRRGKCYLFETAIVSTDLSVLEADAPIKALAPARWKAIRSQFESIMQSIRIGEASTGTALPK